MVARAEVLAWVLEHAQPKAPRGDHRYFARTGQHSGQPKELNPGLGIYAKTGSLKFIIARFGVAESVKALEKLLERFRQRPRERKGFSGSGVVEVQFGRVQEIPWQR